MRIPHETVLIFNPPAFCTNLFRYAPWLQVYNFVMCIWLINFFIALDQITLAGTFATFYFNSQRQRHRHTIVGCCGFWLLFTTCSSALIYNTGSLALGSILITTLWFLRACLLRLERRLKTSDNELAKFFLRCLCCCFWCLEKFLRFLNKNAYIMVRFHRFPTFWRYVFFYPTIPKALSVIQISSPISGRFCIICKYKAHAISVV